MPQYGAFSVFQRVTADSLNVLIPNVVTKVAVTTITSNVTLANDSELVAIPLAVGTWEIYVSLNATMVAGGLGNLKTAWAFTGTTTGTPVKSVIGPAASSTVVPNVVTVSSFAAAAYTTANTYGGGSTTTPLVAQEYCEAFIVSVAGNFSIQVAQGTSNATPTVVQAGSFVRVRQVA